MVCALVLSGIELFAYFLQHSSSLQFILEGIGSCKEHGEELEGPKQGECWLCCFVRTRMFCMVLGR